MIMATSIRQYVLNNIGEAEAFTVEALTSAGYHQCLFSEDIDYTNAYHKALELVGLEHFIAYGYQDFWFEDAALAIQFKLSL